MSSSPFSCNMVTFMTYCICIFYLCCYIYIFFFIFKNKYKFFNLIFLNIVKILKSHTKVIDEPLQAGFLIAGLITSLAMHLDYLEVFVDYFNESIVNNNVAVMINNNRLSFTLPETVSTEVSNKIIKSLESTDSLILNRLKTIDSIVERSITLEGHELDDPDSPLSFCVNRLKTIQPKYKYL